MHAPGLKFQIDATLAGVLALSRALIGKEILQNLLPVQLESYLSSMGIFHHFMNLKAVDIHIGWFQMSITNLVVVLSMLLVFGLALVLPFPGSKKGKGQK